MNLRFWRSWSIGTRMVFITMLPVVYLFCSFVWYSWYSHRAQVAEELAERGRILARALADTSEYNVISGNLADLRVMINGLVQSDRSLYRIEVVDQDRATAVSVTSTLSHDAEDRVFEAPIRKQTIWINLFTENGAPHVSGSSTSRPPTMTSETVGWVRVTMSPSSMMDKQLQRFQVELAMAALALAVSAALAWLLARNLTVPLRTAIAKLRQIRGGNYLVHLPVTTGGEIGELQSSIAEMSIALNHERTADLAKLIQKVNAAVEDERQGIAIEIHDELNASLIAARLEAQAITQLVDKLPAGPEAEAIRAKAQSITRQMLDLYASGRRLVRRLRPEVLDMLGLHGAVEEMVRHYSGECQFSFHSEGDFSRLPSELAISAYRIVQEALSNIMKHAKASEASVDLRLDDTALSIEVRDNGSGFVPASASEGIGIIGMRERVFALGGTISIESAAGSGTAVTIRLPLAVS